MKNKIAIYLLLFVSVNMFVVYYFSISDNHDRLSKDVFSEIVKTKEVKSNTFNSDVGCPDVNGDGKVNIIDASIVATTINLCGGSDKYNFRADITGDGCVDDIDMDVISENFNKIENCAIAIGCPDINYDRSVNILDISWVTSSWFLCNGQNGYKLAADITRDNCANNGDIIAIEKYLNKPISEIPACRLKDGWFSEHWNYRNTINVKNNLNSELTNHQSMINISTSFLVSENKIKPDCSDIRFVDNDMSLLNYWIESGCNSKNTKIWVKIPKIKTEGSSINMYYGNPEAGSESNGSKTFHFFHNKKFNIVSAGAYYTCGLLNDGHVKCWGNNNTNQLEAYNQSGVKALATGLWHACALLNNGNVDCWGWNVNEQAEDYMKNDAIQISAGSEHTCALLNNGNVDCWGGKNSTTVVDDYLFGNAIMVSSGYYHTCVLLNNGNVDCWALDDRGLSDNQSIDYNEGDAIMIGTGAYHTCALLNNGNVKCWGAELNNAGQSEDYLFGNAVSLSVGKSHNCVIVSDGSVKCWGYNGYGQLGDGTTQTSKIAVEAYGLKDVVDLTTGMYHTCALLNNGNVKCWGHNKDMQLGNETSINSSIPIDVVVYKINGRFDKTNNIYHLANHNDNYFVRSFSSLEPTISLEIEEDKY